MGFNIISKLNLPTVKVPQVLFSQNFGSFALIGMSVAKGKPLTELMKDSDEAVRLCARACVELHTAQIRPIKTIEAKQLETFEEAITKVSARLSEVQSQLPSISAEHLTKKWNEIHNNFLRNPGYYSYTHGDPNPNNWIVDLDSQEVTYVDLSLFSRLSLLKDFPMDFLITNLQNPLQVYGL